MANEISIYYSPGATLTARMMQGATVAAASIAMAEVGASPGYYLGSVPGGTAAGTYDVLVWDGSGPVGSGPLRWSGTAELRPVDDVTGAAIKAKTDGLPASPAAVGDIPTPAAVWAAPTRSLTTAAAPTAAANATAVRAELAAELARVDAAVTTRAAVGDIPTVAAIAAAVWGAVTRTLTSAAGITAADVWAHVTRTLTAGGGGGGADPWATVVPGAYANGTAGAALGKLNMAAGPGPAQVIPAPPADVGVCRLYGYFETPDNRIPDVRTADIEIKLVTTGPIASERLIHGRVVKASLNAAGALTGSDGLPFVDLQRTDFLTPAGATYQVSSPSLGVSRKTFTLTTDVADLRELLLA